MDWLKPLNPRGEGSAGDNNDTQAGWLRVLGQASAGQIAVARQTFNRHLAEISLSLAGYHAVTYRLPDGSVMRVVSNSGLHHATLWPSGGPPEALLPHGFAVVTNWARPRIFKRRPASATLWAVDPALVPQVRNDIDTDNQVFRETTSGSFFCHPMVLTKVPRGLWDYVRHSLTAMTSADQTVPVNIEYGTAVTYDTGATHYSRENKILDPAGSTLYTMELSPAILTVDPESPVHVPASTTAAGTEVILQHIRSAIIAPSFGIYQVRFASERLSRPTKNTYSLTERNVTTITGPIGGSSPLNGTSYTDLAEDVDAGISIEYGSSTSATSGSGFSAANGFSFGIIDTTGLGTVTENATRELAEAFAPSAPGAYLKTLALPAATSVEYPGLTTQTNETGSVLWRAGFKQRLVNPSASPVSGFRWFGTYSMRKERIDTSYVLDTSPRSRYDLGWADFDLLTGSTHGECQGKRYTDTAGKGRSVSWWDGFYFSQTYIVQGEPPVFGFTIAEYIANNIKPAVVAYVSPFPPGFFGSENEIETVLVDERPVNTASYTYTSRYAIDYDHKGRFWAAIRVTVACSGAEWRESGAYSGDMVAYADPSYTVSIHLETNWNGTINATLLTTATVTRPGFEFTEVVKQKPSYFLLPAETDKQEMLVRVPPTFGLPIEAMSQMRALATHQGVTPCLVCADVRPDLDGGSSTAGIEFSRLGTSVRPHTKYPTGQLYARTFKLSDFLDALWLLNATKCNATENDDPLAPGATEWFYMPSLKTTIDTQTFHVEVRDGVHELWSDDILPDLTSSGDIGGAGSIPEPTSRDIKLYRV